MQSLPRIDVIYWLALTAASIFGTNTGDFIAGYLHIGHFGALPWLLAAFLVILGLEHFSPVKTPLWFWAAVIALRTAATNVGDSLHGLGMGLAISVPTMLVTLALSIAVYARSAPKRAASDDTVSVNAAYWAAMMAASVLGVVGGDLASKFLSDPGAAAVFAAIVVAAIASSWRRGLLLDAAPYWAVVALICTTGTAGGDTIAHLIGIAPSTFLTGVIFLILVTVSSRSPAAAPGQA
jgi:uncharacterized membrane-anchored protein